MKTAILILLLIIVCAIFGNPTMWGRGGKF